ncbi:MAG: SMP-30/gluconolactonase/LRE family protein [Pseudomonadota bacterium]
MTITIDCVAPTRSKVGEGAVWDDREQVLWWLDIPAGLIHRYDPATHKNQTIDYGEPVGCLAVREQGGLVLATKSGFWFFDPRTGEREALSDPEAGLPHNRFNDGTTDRQGRFWAGTMKEGGEPERLGQFYRLDPDASVTPCMERVFTTNGLAFSPDGTRMYFSDSNKTVRTIWVCDYDTKTGTPGEPRLFFDTRLVAGRPDGGTVDAEGCYWQAGIDGWQLYRISPKGALLSTIDMPVEKPSKPTFGGPDLDTLFVTSLGVGLTPGTEHDQPEAGSLFAITGLGLQGVPQTRFIG